MNKIAQVPIGPTLGSPFGQTRGIADFISIILSNAVVIAGIILLILLIFGGLSVIIGAGQNNPEKAAQGQKAITSAIIGFLIIFAAYWIVYWSQQIFGFNILTPST